MSQLFSPRANVYSRVIIFGAVILVCGAGWATSEIFWSPYTTYVAVPFDQPVPFSFHRPRWCNGESSCK